MNNYYALEEACKTGDLDKVKELVSDGADITANNNYAVQLASNNGHLDVVKYLVSLGADITVDDNFKWYKPPPQIA